MILFNEMILYAKMFMRWGWEKKNRKKMKKNIPRLVALPSPLLGYRGRLFSGVREHQKQAVSDLCGRGS